MQLLKPFATLVLLLITSASIAQITVFGASSMTNVIEEAKAEYVKQHPQAVINVSFASSSKLARQIENGYPASIFISANPKWMEYVQTKNLVVNSTLSNFAGNQLVMIAPINSSIQSVDLSNNHWVKLLDNNYLAIGEPNAVPAGRYAQQALVYLKTWDLVKNKVALAQNVRSALALVEQGESPLGIVYATDAKLSQKVKIVAVFPSASHDPIIYPIVILQGQDNPESRGFYDFLKSTAGQKILLKYGFSPVK